ncbi:MAG: hypothetical protein WC314_18155 [Vulcanimicrobiota bacterium]
MIDEMRDQHGASFIQILPAQKPEASCLDRRSIFLFDVHPAHERGGDGIIPSYKVLPLQSVELNRAVSETEGLEIRKFDFKARWSRFTRRRIREHCYRIDRDPMALN